MSEFKRSSLLVETRPAVDETESGYLDTLNTSTDPTYNRLKIPKEELDLAKEAFMAGDGELIPDLRPLHLSETDLLLNESDWLNFKDRLKASALPPMLKQGYLWRVNEEIAQERIVMAAAGGDARAFKAYNEFIYGKPDPKLTADTIDWFRQDAQKNLEHENPDVREAAEKVLRYLPDRGGDRQYLVPDPETFANVRELHFREDGYFALLFAGIEVPDIPKIDTETGDPILWQALRNLESDYVVADAPAKAWSADSTKVQLQRPAVYNMPYKRFLGLPGHEFKHIVEIVNGYRQETRLAGSGFDRYEFGNEGRAVIVEQVPYLTFESFSEQLRWQDIMRRFLAAALASGNEQHEAMDFSKTYKVIASIDELWERKKKPDSISAADEKAHNRSWDLLSTKTFVGTAGSAGSVYLKNSVYLPGNLAMWAVAKANPELIDAGDFGKFDLSNPRHIALAQEFNILPSPSH